MHTEGTKYPKVNEISIPPKNFYASVVPQSQCLICAAQLSQYLSLPLVQGHCQSASVSVVPLVLPPVCGTTCLGLLCDIAPPVLVFSATWYHPSWSSLQRGTTHLSLSAMRHHLSVSSATSYHPSQSSLRGSITHLGPPCDAAPTISPPQCGTTHPGLLCNEAPPILIFFATWHHPSGLPHNAVPPILVFNAMQHHPSCSFPQCGTTHLSLLRNAVPPILVIPAMWKHPSLKRGPAKLL